MSQSQSSESFDTATANLDDAPDTITLLQGLQNTMSNMAEELRIIRKKALELERILKGERIQHQEHLETIRVKAMKEKDNAEAIITS